MTALKSEGADFGDPLKRGFMALIEKPSWCRVVPYIVAALFLQSTFVNAQTAREIAGSAFGSVALIVMEDADGAAISLGSGLVVGPGLVATNMHVVQGATRGYVRLVGSKKKLDIEGAVGVDVEHDLAVLKVPGIQAKVLPIGDSKEASIGDTVYAIGNPLGLEGTFSQGIISSIRKAGGEDLLQITAPISPGSSGGPVLNEKGAIVGVAVATYKAGQNLNFAVPSVYLSALLNRLTAVAPLPVRTRAVEGVSPYGDIGEKSTEGVGVSDFTWDGRFGHFSVSVRNRLRDPVKGIYFRIVFYNKSGEPIETVEGRMEEEIPAGLARRVTNLRVDKSVQDLSSTMRPKILDFTVVHQ